MHLFRALDISANLLVIHDERVWGRCFIETSDVFLFLFFISIRTFDAIINWSNELMIQMEQQSPRKNIEFTSKILEFFFVNKIEFLLIKF